jgi:DNA polymerase III delta subunit
VPRVHLIASPDDYLLEIAIAEVVGELRAGLDGVEPELFGPETAPEDLALELCSPSLFTPQRLLVAPEVASWVDVPAQRRPGQLAAEPARIDAAPLARVLADGLPEGVALVLGACCHSRPKGALVGAVESVGELAWRPLPEPPKPWEDVAFSAEQERLLGEVLERAAGPARLTPTARRLLCERLGFAPRALAQEARKLAAASAGGVIDEELVLALSFPRERSLEVVWEAILERRAAPLLDLLAAAEGNWAVRDRRGQAVRREGVPAAVVGQAAAALQQLLYLRRLADRSGLASEMAPARTGADYWYPRSFSKGIGPQLASLLEAEAPSPLVRAGAKPPTMFRLAGLFKGAGRYSDDELVRALAEVGEVEASLRGGLGAEALTVWLAGFIARP